MIQLIRKAQLRFCAITATIIMAFTTVAVATPCVSEDTVSSMNLQAFMLEQTTAERVRKNVMYLLVNDFPRTTEEQEYEAYGLEYHMIKVYSVGSNNTLEMQIIGEEFVQQLYDFIDTQNGSDKITLIINGGAYGDCLFKSFMLSVYRAVVERNKAIHVILPEAAIADGHNTHLRAKYKRFLRDFPEDVRLYIDDDIDELITTKNKDGLYPVTTTITTKKNKELKQFLDDHIVNVSRSMRTPTFARLQAVINNIHSPQTNVSDLLHLYRDACAMTDAEIARMESLITDRDKKTGIAGIRTSVPQMFSAVLLITEKLTDKGMIRTIGDLSEVMKKIVITLNAHFVEYGRVPSEPLVFLMNIINKPKFLESISSVDELLAFIKGASMATNNMYGGASLQERTYNLSNLFNSPLVMQSINSLDDYFVLLNAFEGNDRLHVSEEFLQYFTYMQKFDVLKNVEEQARFLRLVKGLVTGISYKQYDTYMRAFMSTVVLLSGLGAIKDIDDIEEIVSLYSYLSHSYSVTEHDMQDIIRTVYAIVDSDLAHVNVRDLQDYAAIAKRVTEIPKSYPSQATNIRDALQFYYMMNGDKDATYAITAVLNKLIRQKSYSGPRTVKGFTELFVTENGDSYLAALQRDAESKVLQAA
ncbi:MAG: hypothetical protein JW938_06815 [Candidatus Omnitrophica bacterium]|nr:hypothetical protein [Candidatus Omnitrophota bacterium]